MDIGKIAFAQIVYLRRELTSSICLCLWVFFIGLIWRQGFLVNIIIYQTFWSCRFFHVFMLFIYMGASCVQYEYNPDEEYGEAESKLRAQLESFLETARTFNMIYTKVVTCLQFDFYTVKDVSFYYDLQLLTIESLFRKYLS